MGCHRGPKGHEGVQVEMQEHGRQMFVYATKVVAEKVVVEQVTTGQRVSS